jgi:hypothetical protein
MSHRKTDLGIPRRSKSAKVVLGRVLIDAQIAASRSSGSRVRCFAARKLPTSVSKWLT